jgi:hypothetical protein
MNRKRVYSFRLGAEVPMLTDEEHADVVRDAHATIDAIMAYRAQTGASLEEAQRALPKPSAERYYKLTGFKLWTVYDVFYVRRSDYGSDCPSCGKPYRTPRARYCAECGHGLPVK